MGMVAILVMWPRLFEQLFFPKGPGVYIWNLVATGTVDLEERSSEIVDGRWTTEPHYTILWDNLGRFSFLYWKWYIVCTH